ncbi:FmdB family transcriptional regulator [Mycobacterium sp. Aquia_216]|uniref:FmdB family zinc ribbon protein n=1 Tax=Mycobacterium sp. Aquia_216 TaxID=2991729 RepID=UPI00227A9745|nr:FmdB family zinc ribbon protein [Mycobacterium sp. Aquia_216]WAJ44357.1 FmdB family transcriptional regulator [Mycobacterium sp. Aquia_216]
MPTYSYACTECGDRFDIVQAFTDDTLTTCEKCSGRLRKLFNSVGVVFKGSGFYRTDSRESGKKAAASNNGSSTNGSSESSGSGEKSGDSEKSSSSDKSTSSEKSSSSASSAAATSS